MATKTRVKKKVNFYSLYQLKDGVRHDMNLVDWKRVMTEVATLPIKQRVAGEYIYVPTVDEAGRGRLAVHRPLSMDFMSTVDSDTMEVQDVPVADLDAMFAHSTAVVFLLQLNVFGLVGGSGVHSQGKPAIVDFLNEFMKPGLGATWEAEPLMDRDRIDDFRKSDGVTEFYARFDSENNLILPEAKGIFGFGDVVADRIGSDVEVEIRVKLPKDAPQTVAAKLKNLILKDEGRWSTNKGGGARVKAKKGPLSEELNLVAARFAVEREIVELRDHEASFSILMDLAGAVTGEYEDRIEALRKE